MERTKDNNSKINVIIFQKYIAPYRVNLFNKLSNYPHINLLLCYYGKKEKRRQWIEYPKINYKEHNCKVLSIKINYEKNLNLPFIIGPYLFRHKTDVVICFSDIAGFFLLLFKIFLNYKIILWSEATTHSESNISFLKKLWRKIFLKKTDCFILPGINAVNYIKEFSNEKKVFIANNTVDDIFEIDKTELINKFDKLEIVKIIFAGSLIKRKGFDILLDSLDLLSKKKLNRKYHVNIVGEGEELKRIIPCVTYSGFLQMTDFAKLIKESHITVVPSRTDINPLIMIEAIKSGNVVVCSNFVENYPEIIESNGVVLDELNAEFLSDTLVSFINYPKDKLTNMSLKSLEKSKNFSHSKSAESFKQAIEYSVNKKIKIK